jgi:hypothetical protein
MGAKTVPDACQKRKGIGRFASRLSERVFAYIGDEQKGERANVFALTRS